MTTFFRFANKRAINQMEDMDKHNKQILNTENWLLVKLSMAQTNRAAQRAPVWRIGKSSRR
jgi:hypothetical protein